MQTSLEYSNDNTFCVRNLTENRNIFMVDVKKCCLNRSIIQNEDLSLSLFTVRVQVKTENSQTITAYLSDLQPIQKLIQRLRLRKV